MNEDGPDGTSGPRPVWSLPESVALVAGEGDARRDTALGLAARGVRVVVLGADERAIAEIVGEIAFGGGKGRHVVGDPKDPAALAAAAARAREVFGGLDATYGCEIAGVRAMPLPARF